MHFWSIKVVYFLQNANDLNFKLFLGCISIVIYNVYSIFIGPESDHWECLSVTNSLTHSLTDCCLVNLIDVALACEDAHSKLVEVVSDAEVEGENHVGNILLHIWGLRLDHKAKEILS